MAPAKTKSLHRNGKIRPWEKAIVWSTGWRLLFCLIFLVLFNAFIIVSFDKQTLEFKKEPQYFLLASFVMLLVSYTGCTLVSAGIVNFASEIRLFSTFRITKLWRLASRVYLIPLIVLLGIAPLGSWLITVKAEFRDFQPALLWINLILVQLMFLTGAVYVGLQPEPSFLMRKFLSILLPFRFISYFIIRNRHFVILFYIAGGAIFGAIGHALAPYISSFAQWIEQLYQIPVVGSLLLFWLNPFYVMFKLHAYGTVEAQSAFGVATTIVTVVMFLRLRTALRINYSERDTAIYNEWLEIRKGIPLRRVIPNMSPEGETRADHGITPAEDFLDSGEPPGTNDDTLSNLNLSGVAMRGLSRVQLPYVKVSAPPSRRTVSATDFILPEYGCAEAFVAGMHADKSPLPGNVWQGLVLTMAILSLITNPWFNVGALGIWILLTSTDVWPARLVSWTTPQRVWPVIGWFIRRRLFPLLPVDAAFALVIVIAFDLRLIDSVPLFMMIALFRLMMLNLKIAYGLQSLGLFVPLLGAMLLYLALCSASINVKTDGYNAVLLWACWGISSVCLLISWLWLGFFLRFKYGNLLHMSIG